MLTHQPPVIFHAVDGKCLRFLESMLTFPLCIQWVRMVDAMTRQEFEDLYRLKGALVLRRCRLMLGTQGAAEEVMQEVFLRVWLNRHTFESSVVPLSWLYRTAVRCCIDYMRKHKRESLKEVAQVEAIRPSMHPEKQLIDRQLLQRFLQELDPKLLELALLYYVDDLNQEECAAILGWSRRTIGKKLQWLTAKVRSFQGDAL